MSRRTASAAPVPPPADLEVEFAKAALTGLLLDPNVNPRNEDALVRVVDFCWLVARTMVERRPPPNREMH